MCTGHRQWEKEYWVPRTKIPLNKDVLWYVQALLPQYPFLLVQHQGTGGDKSGTARKFLEKILPYLVQVLVQDGAFLVQDFPENPVSTVLTQSIDGYCTWASTARSIAKNLGETREASSLAKLPR